jgi:tetratricopeptide (TPR) repeat protein
MAANADLDALDPTPDLAQAARALRAGRPADAIPWLRNAALLRPGNANILHDLGLACLECGQLEEAIAVLQRAIAANPRFADAYLRLGIALEASSALEGALEAYRRASALEPSLADARYREGNLLDSLGQSPQAGAAFRAAATTARNTVLGRIAAARAKLVDHRDAEAERILRRTLALHRGNAVALELLGNLLADSARFAEAREMLLQAVEQSPLHAGSYYDIVRCRRVQPCDSRLIASMRAALAVPGLEPAQRSRVHLALGKAADDLGDYQQAMAHFDAAEALRNSVVQFDLAAFEARIDRVIARFTPTTIAQAARARDHDCAPILIFGLPRSGTTLVEQILSAHREVGAGGELPFWNQCGTEWDRAGAPVQTADETASQAAAYLAQLRAIAPRAALVTDKMPLNVQWAGLIHAALPRATMILCRRRPIDTALSIHQTHFNPRMSFPTGGAALVGYVRATQRLEAHWRQVLPPAQFIEVAYEDLVTTPEPVIRGMVARCGLPWDDACLHPERNTGVVRTPSKWQTRQPIYRSAIDRWRRYAPWLGKLSPLLDDEPFMLTAD